MLIKIHSETDKITNSSTVICTHSENSLPAFTKLAKEIFKLIGIAEKVEDVFDIKVVHDNACNDDCDCGCSDYGDSTLSINAKDPKYNTLARLLVEFLYSTETEEHDG